MKTQAFTLSPDARLADVVTALLIKYNHPEPEAWRIWNTGLHPDCNSSTDLNIQRFLINRQLRMQIGLVDADTTIARQCLNDQSEVSIIDYVRLLEEGVIPCMVRHQIPLK